MDGNFGVFDYTELLVECGNDEDADEYRRSLPGSHIPVYESELRVAEIPEDYHFLWRTLAGLTKSRDHDRAQEALQEETPHDA